MSYKSPYKIDSNIRKADTLKSSFYTDKNIFRNSIEKIFSSTWQYGLDINALKSKNIYPIDFLPETVCESLVITKNKEEINCISNVCTHRGHIVCQKHKKGNNLSCRYHGRSFSLDGKLKNAVGFENSLNFPTPKDNLTEIPLRKWKNFLFFSLSKDSNNLFALEDIDSRLDKFPFNRLNFSEELSNSFVINTHWAMYCENYLEGFHVPFVHKGLSNEINNQSYTTELLENAVLQYASKKDADDDLYAHYYWIFPNLMLNFYSWGLSINIVEPISNDKTRVHFLTFPIDESDDLKESILDLIKVEYEDQAVVESVCKGMKSRFYDSGRYSPKHEKGVHYFHSLLSRYI